MLQGQRITFWPVREVDLGTARGAFFAGGRNLDVLICSLVRDDPRPWQTQ